MPGSMYMVTLYKESGIFTTSSSSSSPHRHFIEHLAGATSSSSSLPTAATACPCAAPPHAWDGGRAQHGEELDRGHAVGALHVRELPHSTASLPSLTFSATSTAGTGAGDRTTDRTRSRAQRERGERGRHGRVGQAGSCSPAGWGGVRVRLPWFAREEEGCPTEPASTFAEP